MRKLLSDLLVRRRHRRAALNLLACDDHLLDDIGISRNELVDVLTGRTGRLTDDSGNR